MTPQPQEPAAGSFLTHAANLPSNSLHTATPWDALLRQVANSLPAMVWICGADGRATLFNKNWLQFTGQALHAALGDGWVAAIHPDDVEARLATQQAGT